LGIFFFLPEKMFLRCNMKILRKVKDHDLSEKYLIELGDKNTVEALYMCDPERTLTFSSTLCISSQVGCAVGCAFCATGRQGFVRHLDEKEMAGQVLLAVKDGGKNRMPLEAVVFAGMGEPLYNMENVTAAMLSLREELGLSRHELATAGVAPKIEELAHFVRETGIFIRLNLSLHAPTDEKRACLIPMTARYDIKTLLDAADAYARLTDTTVRLRYMLIKGLNDTEEDAKTLIQRLAGRRVKLILSGYNDNQIKGLQPVCPGDIEAFYHRVKNEISCGIFRNFGAEIAGGCGQLRRMHYKDKTG
jgi:23S rRNA (adenine2503-C2)-methyltransferase